MRELENNYDNAHGSSDPPLVTTFEPEVREDKRGNKEEKSWYEKVGDFFKNLWTWYTNSLKEFVLGFELEPPTVRVLTGFLIVFVLALVLLIITLVVMGLFKAIKTSKENVVRVGEATMKFREKLANMETEADMNRILKTSPVIPQPAMPPAMPQPPTLKTKTSELPIVEHVDPIMNMPKLLDTIQEPTVVSKPLPPKPTPLPMPPKVSLNYNNLGMSRMRFNELAKDTYKKYSRSGLLGSMGFKEFVDEYKQALRQMRN